MQHPRSVSKEKQRQSAAIQELARKRAQQQALRERQQHDESTSIKQSPKPADPFGMGDLQDALEEVPQVSRELLATVASTPLPGDEAPSEAPSTSAAQDLVDGQFRLTATIASTLYTHQHAGVRWLCSLHRLKRGGILAVRCCQGRAALCFIMPTLPHRTTWDLARYRVCTQYLLCIMMFNHPNS